MVISNKIRVINEISYKRIAHDIVNRVLKCVKVLL